MVLVFVKEFCEVDTALDVVLWEKFFSVSDEPGAVSISSNKNSRCGDLFIVFLYVDVLSAAFGNFIYCHR